jgi:outer membrane lipoprotein-sorting protein
MRPSENIEKLVENIDIDTNAKIDEEVLVEVVEAFEKSKVKKTSATEQNIWRIIMKSRIIKLAAAAVIIIACLTGLFLWKNTGSGIALADVLTKIEQVTGYRYQLSSTITRQQTSRDWTSTVLVSRDNSMKMVAKMVDPNNGEIKHEDTYFLPRQNSIVFVMHEPKAYIRLKFDHTEMENYREKYNDPRIIIKHILSCDHTSLGQSVIDEITVEGFQTRDLAYNGGFIGHADLRGQADKVDVKIWVDINTFLPVRSEEDIVTKKGTRLHEVSSNFKWNVVLDAADFEPDIPDDYTLEVDLTVPPLNEETAIKGLRIFADLAGDYPDNFDRSTISKETKRLIRLEKDSWKSLADDERSRRRGDISTTITQLRRFYNQLVEDKKETTYYGETVGPDDTNKILLRWKLDDGQYRVIFGDLSIKNVTAEELAELEKP